MLLTETWTSPQTEPELGLDGYECFMLHRLEKKRRTKRESGGLAVYFRSGLAQGIKLVKQDSDDIMWLRLSKEFFGFEKDLYVCLCYVVPHNSTRQDLITVDVYDRLLLDLAKFESEGDNWYLVAGDFNARTADKPDYVELDNITYLPLPENYTADTNTKRASQDAKAPVTEYGHKLLNLCIATGLRIMNGRLGSDKDVGKFTCQTTNGASVVDYILGSELMFSDTIYNFTVEEHGPFSDHNCVLCHLKIALQLTGVNQVETHCCKQDKFVWDKDKTADYIEALSDASVAQALGRIVDDVDTNTAQGIESAVDQFVKTIEHVANPLFRKRSCTNQCTHEFNDNNRFPEWMCDLCKAARVEFHTQLNNHRAFKTEESRKCMVVARNNYCKHTRNCRLQFDRQETQKLLQSRLTNAKEYWRMLRGKVCTRKPNISSNQYFEYFKEVSAPNSEFFVPDDDIGEYVDKFDRGELQVMYAELDCLLTEEEVTKAIKQLKLNKSAGPDLLLNELFIYGRTVLLPYVTSLFNKIFESGHFPEMWSKGIITPIHKKGSIHDVGNYRGITLLSSFGKLFTRVLNNRLNSWSENYNVYIEAQGGFRKGMGTTDSIFVLHNLVNWFINQKRTLYCTFIDYRKAFDYVVHKNLWYKLLNIGISGKMLTVIQSMYSRARACVKSQTGLSDSFDCILGVRQGESLSPFLFAMFINDLESTLQTSGMLGLNMDTLKLFIVLYADDAVLLSESREDMQAGLNILSEYCKRWRLTLNTDKTKVVIFRTGGRPNRLDKWYYNGALLEVVSYFTYLGLVFSRTGSFSCAQQTLAKQGRKAVFSLYKMTKRFAGIDPLVMCDLFDKMIVPILSYGCEVWGFHKGDAVEKVHREFLKHVLKVKSTTVNEFVYGEFGRRPLINLRYCRIVKYWFKILKSSATRLTRRVYLAQKRVIDVSENKVNWVSLLKDMLLSFGFGEAWYNQGVGDEDSFMMVFKQRVNDMYMQTWSHNLESTRKSISYRHFHTLLSPCTYLKNIANVQHRMSLTRFRTRNNRLRVETGSWGNSPVPFEERYCQCCNNDIVEDEYHFLLVCSQYNDIRKKYIPRFYRRRPNMQKFVQLLSSENCVLQRKLAAFTFYAFKNRNDLLYS